MIFDAYHLLSAPPARRGSFIVGLGKDCRMRAKRRYPGAKSYRMRPKCPHPVFGSTRRGNLFWGDGVVFRRGATRVGALDVLLGRVSVWLGAILPVATPWARSEVCMGHMGVWHSRERGQTAFVYAVPLLFSKIDLPLQ